MVLCCFSPIINLTYSIDFEKKELENQRIELKLTELLFLVHVLYNYITEYLFLAIKRVNNITMSSREILKL